MLLKRPPWCFHTWISVALSDNVQLEGAVPVAAEDERPLHLPGAVLRAVRCGRADLRSAFFVFAAFGVRCLAPTVALCLSTLGHSSGGRRRARGGGGM